MARKVLLSSSNSYASTRHCFASNLPHRHDSSTPDTTTTRRSAAQHRARVVRICQGHHGEILQGVFYDSAGRKRRGLVTLPCPVFKTVAWAGCRDDDRLEVVPKEKTNVRKALLLLFEHFSVRHAGVSVRLQSNIPIGFGLGSSTADIVAAMRACADALALPVTNEQLFSFAVAAEEASDATMFSGNAHLVAHREGLVLEEFPAPLPTMGLISVNTAPDQPVRTQHFPPARYSPEEVQRLQNLRSHLRTALADRDPYAIGKVATKSALINQRRLPQTGLPEIVKLARNAGAYGVQVAHSGRMVGVLVPPDLPRDAPMIHHIQEGIQDLGLFPTHIRRIE